MPLNDLNYLNTTIDLDVMKKIPQKIAKELNIFPFKMDDDFVYVLSYCNINTNVLNYIEFVYKKNIKTVIVEKEEFNKITAKYYEKIAFDGAINELENINLKNKNENLYKVNNLINNAPAVKIINLTIAEAINKNASDIHIEPFKNFVLIRFRIDGKLIDYKKVSKNAYLFLLTRIKVMANMDISKKFVPCDGKIFYEFDDKKFDLRISTIPTIHGEKIVIRLLNKNNKIFLDNLGFDTKSSQIIKDLIKKPDGMILIVGPTGSGKTTSLYAILNELNKNENNITTIEDPVEYNIERVNQININNKAGLTFSGCLRAVLRQDPDIIMIGEIRDSETAQIAVRAAMTGHLVFSTLHTKSSEGTILRLLDMGIENYLLSDTLRAIICQRLVRKICPHCVYEYNPSYEERQILKLNSNEKLFKGKGCKKCNFTGYLSRTVIYDIKLIEKDEKEFIRNINCSKQKYVQNLFNENAINMVKKGITTYEEIIKYLI